MDQRHVTIPTTEITKPSGNAANVRPTTPSRRSIDNKSLAGSYAESYVDIPPPSPGVPKLPEPLFDTSDSLSLEKIIAASKIGETDVDPKKKEMVEKRASNVLRLAQESEKLNAELKALADRLRAAEERAKQAEERRREREARERERALEQVQVLDDVSTP